MDTAKPCATSPSPPRAENQVRYPNPLPHTSLSKKYPAAGDALRASLNDPRQIRGDIDRDMTFLWLRGDFRSTGRTWPRLGLHADIAEAIIRPFGRAFQLGIVLTGQTQARELEMPVALAILTAGPEKRYYVAQFLERY